MENTVMQTETNANTSQSVGIKAVPSIQTILMMI